MLGGQMPIEDSDDDYHDDDFENDNKNEKTSNRNQSI